MSETAFQSRIQAFLPQWSKHPSSSFYSALTEKELNQFLSRSGLGQNNDLHMLEPHFQNAKKILDIGAGFGRLADWYVKQSYQGQLTCLEQVSKMCLHIKKNHLGTRRVSIICGDIRTFQTQQKYDLIVWLWSGLNDLNPQEQNIVAGSLASLLSSNGTIVIDTFDPRTTGINSHLTECGYYIITHGRKVLYGFNPSLEMIKKYTYTNHLLLDQVKYYTAPGGIKRAMYFISHSSE